ncbi:response regulator [Sessilibacter corallicola]|uniref:histidine kinase n=1 Tax=Sessilibacter corallicola TaxID=2904075 RepID=A0ABQ0A447_9GAMM|nr:response regulator [Sessilibacter corallicola]MCE2026954.1 response regulator [Sessilibacter corallicola]
MYFRQVQHLLRKLTLIPIFITALVLGIALATFYYFETNKTSREQLKNLASIAAELSSPYLDNNLQQSLQRSLSAIIQHEQVRSVRLLNTERNIVAHLGPRYIRKYPVDNWLNNTVEFSMIESDTLRIAHPVFSQNQGEIIGWIDIAFDTNQSKYLYIEMILAILAICFISPAIIALFLQDRVGRLKPELQEIEQSVHSIIQGDYSHRIDANPDSSLAPMIEDINAIADSVTNAQADLKQNIEHSLAELQETMETIEIQNIELDIARKKALEASEVKSEFLANASHEFRTPLNGIIGFTQLLLKGDTSEIQQEYLRTIESSAQGLLTIINDILDISHIEAGTVKLDFIPMQLDSVIEETLQILAPTAFDNLRELHYQIDPKLPKDVVSDPLRIKQILTNLLNGAIEFSSQKDISVCISTDQETNVKNLATNTQNYLFEITGFDSALNLDTETALRAFANLDSGSSRNTAENGLGLAISKGLIKALGGTMGYRENTSNPSLWFSIPLTEGQSKNTDTKKALSGISILACSENPSMLAQLKSHLSAWKVNVTESKNLDSILNRLQKLKDQNRVQQLLIIDVPVEENNHTATSFLDQITYQVNNDFRCKTILITTPAKQRELTEAQVNRAVTYCNKPVVHERLYKTICNHLNITKHITSKAPVSEFLLSGRKLKILAVDDNPANLMLVREFLSNLGIDVTTANTGQDAIKACENKRFDMIFMDIQMPDIDGIAATKVIRENQPAGLRTPIVALTAHAVNDRKSELLLAGLDDYLSKPITQEQLSHVIQRWCQGVQKSTAANKVAQQSQELLNPKADDDIIPVEVTTIASSTINHNDQALDEINLESPTKPSNAAPAISEQKIAKPVDIQQCIQLSNKNVRLAKEMLTLLLTSLPDSLKTIKKSVDNNDMEKLEDVVHKLRGGSSYTGVPKLAKASTELDKLLFKKEYHRISPSLASTTEAIEELISWHNEYDLDGLFFD